MSATKRLKTGLLADLRLMRAKDWDAYWQQANWPKPDLTALSASQLVSHQDSGKRAEIFSPLRYALSRLDPTMLAVASQQPDPFGWLLEQINLEEWAEFCRARKSPWMANMWLATASQLRAELRLVFKSNGWSGTWEALRKNPRDLQAAVDFFCAQLYHARGNRRRELQSVRPAGLSEATLRRIRRAKKGQGNRAGVAPAEKYLVQHWLELPHGFPGLCFFSDTAIHSLLVVFGLVRTSAEAHVTTLLRGRIGLVQAGIKVHLIEQVNTPQGALIFDGRRLKSPFICKGKISWGRQTLWPR